MSKKWQNINRTWLQSPTRARQPQRTAPFSDSRGGRLYLSFYNRKAIYHLAILRCNSHSSACKVQMTSSHPSKLTHSQWWIVQHWFWLCHVGCSSQWSVPEIGRIFPGRQQSFHRLQDLKKWKLSSLLEFTPTHIVWKLLKMSHFNFWVLVFSTNFCPFKTDLSGNTVWPQASGFQKLAKIDHFGIFN